MRRLMIGGEAGGFGGSVRLAHRLTGRSGELAERIKPRRFIAQEVIQFNIDAPKPGR